MDEYRIDSHKLIYHVRRLDQWLSGRNIYPIYLEVGLYGGCNHRCVFCAFDFFKYQPDVFETALFKQFIKEASSKGVKSVLFSGEGEPLLHKDIAEIVRFTKKAGVDVALVTNGVLFDRDKAEKLLPYLSWVKISMDAGSRDTHSFIHGAKKDDFNTIVENIRKAVKIRNKNKHACTIGVQALLLPQNYEEMAPLAKIVSGLGVDYLVIKPYCTHPSSIHKLSGSGFSRFKLSSLEEKLKQYNTKNFRVVLRRRAMEKRGQSKPYKHCLGLPFAAHITAKGNIYPCNVFLGKKDFIFGNIQNDSFSKIWQGTRRGKIMKFLHNKCGTKKCRSACRLDEINRYLWELKNPVKHVNFI